MHQTIQTIKKIYYGNFSVLGDFSFVRATGQWSGSKCLGAEEIYVISKIFKFQIERMGSDKYLETFQRVKSQQNLINDDQNPNRSEYEPMFHGALIQMNTNIENSIAIFFLSEYINEIQQTLHIKGIWLDTLKSIEFLRCAKHLISNDKWPQK